MDGVGGTGMLVTLLLAGVMMVRLILPNFRFGGVGGLTNAGEAGQDTGSCGFGDLRGAVAIARPRLYDAVVLTARFLRFRGLLAEDAGRCNSNTGSVGSCWVVGFSIGVKRDSFMANDMAVGDCGEGPGDGSVMLEESKETVVVGDESVDSDADVEVLCLGLWKGLKDMGSMGLNIVSLPAEGDLERSGC
jgi:hypothetical protein